MKIKFRTYLLLVALFFITGCGAGVNKLTINEAYTIPPTPWKKIAVLPFSGQPEFRRISGEWMAFQIKKQSKYDIVAPTLVEIELGKNGMDLPEKEFTVEEAQKAGKLLGADAVITGKVGVNLGFDIPAAVEAQLIDALSGDIVVTAAQKDPELIRWAANFHEVVIGATDATSKELLAVLNGLAEGKLESGK